MVLFLWFNVRDKDVCSCHSFLKWAEEQFGADVIETFPNVNVLCERLSDRPIRERINIKTVDNINALFSDAIIANTFKKLCEK